MTAGGRRIVLSLLLTASPLLAQTTPPHDITRVDPVPAGGAIAVPLQEHESRKMRKYDIPDLAGARQALGSQLIDGRLPKPYLDYRVQNDEVDQRISIFEGGLVVVRMTGGGTIQKRVLIPDDALAKYLAAASPERLASIGEHELPGPSERRRAQIRVYGPDQTVIERLFDPTAARPGKLHNAVGPLEDLLRAISEDRAVTSTVAGYEPKVGDELVGDDGRIWRVERVIPESEMVQLHCTTQPTLIYVAKKDLYNYFVGRAE